MNLPLVEGEFDSVVCQFGLMLASGILQALRAARQGAVVRGTISQARGTVDR